MLYALVIVVSQVTVNSRHFSLFASQSRVSLEDRRYFGTTVEHTRHVLPLYGVSHVEYLRAFGYEGGCRAFIATTMGFLAFEVFLFFSCAMAPYML
jgi:hypothetical protein